MSPTIRFIPAMYAAALSGRKTQTRRVITPQPSFHFSPTIGLFHPSLVDRRTGEAYPGPETGGCYDDTEHYFPTYGPPGTTLPIVTTWAVRRMHDTTKPCDLPQTHCWIWWDDGTKKPAWAGKSRPAMFFPKTLYHLARQARILSVKAERVQSISDSDAIHEGLAQADGAWMSYSPEYTRCMSPVTSYRTLWDSINATRGQGPQKGQYAWKNNPWVFATTFEVLPPTSL